MEWWEPAQLEAPDERAVRLEQVRLLARAIAALSEQQRRVLVLLYVHDMSFSEVGSALRVSKVAAWKAHQRALDILAAELAAMGMKRG